MVRYSEGFRRGWTVFSYFYACGLEVETGKEGMKDWYRSIGGAVGLMA